MNTVSAAIACVAIYAAMESAWLFSMSSFYAAEFAKFARHPVGMYDVAAVGMVYALIAASFWFFVLAEIQRTTKPIDAFLRGAFFGFALYGVYNLTNRVTLKGYSWQLVAVDALWGAAVYGIVALLFCVFLGAGKADSKVDGLS